VRADEAAHIVAYMLAAYPTANLNDDNGAAYVLTLTAYERDEVEQAAIELISTQKWFPSLSELGTAVLRRRLALPGDTTAYEQVRKRHSGSTLHPLVAEALEVMGGMASFRTTTDPERWHQSFARVYRDLVNQTLRNASLESAGIPLSYEPGVTPITDALAEWDEDGQRLINEMARRITPPEDR